MVLLKRYNQTRACQKHESHLGECVQQIPLLPMLLIFYSIYRGVFSTKSPLMVVTLETCVQRELQTDTSVFNRYLNNANLNIQQLPDFGTKELPQERHSPKKSKDQQKTNKTPNPLMFIWHSGNCIYFLSDILHTRNHPLHMESEYKNSCETPYIYIITHIYGIFTLQMIPTIISSCESRGRAEVS